MDESNVVPINQNTEIQQPAVAAESGEAGPHPGHGVIDEIERLLKVQGAGKWLHDKLDELRNLL